MVEKKNNDIFEVIRCGKKLLENSDNKELFDQSYLDDFDNREKYLNNQLKRASSKNRKLTIGIIGAVKAGKSSFLNALLFDGEEYLPKAITPTTATLTKISYAETPKAIVHFFDDEDWAQIEKYNDKYRSRLDSAYNEYCYNYEEQIRDKQNLKKEQVLLNKEDFEIKYFRGSSVDEREASAVELKQMISSNEGILKLLGKDIELDGNIIEKLTEYIDAKGKYTAIVKYVELKVSNKNLKGIEVIDTPGLYDPVVSRGQKTKEELQNCDVVLLLSSVCEFLPRETINLMVNSLPSAGVREVLIIGSRYDDGITDIKGGDFLTTAKKTKVACEKSFVNNMEKIKRSGNGSELLTQIEESDRLYISSMCYVLSKKLKNGINFTAEEKKIYEQLQAYSGFEDKYLSLISGINDVRKRLNVIVKEKERITKERDNNLIKNNAVEFAKTLSTVKTYVETNNIKLRNMTKEDLEEKSQRIQNALILSRKQLENVFEINGLQCKKKLISTKSILGQEKTNYMAFKTTTDTSEEIHTVKAGLFGLRKDTVKTTVITKKASTAPVIMNLQSYNARCVQIINDEFTYLFNQDQFIRKIKEIIMKAFEAGDTDYEKEDILLPVEKLVEKLKLPEVFVDVNKQIDLLNSKFIKGFAENDEIYELNSIQARLLGEIESEYEEQVTKNGQTISEIMNQESVGFADELEKKFSSDRKKLLKQMEEQEKYIELNASFAKQLGDLIKRFKEIQDVV